MTWFEIFCLLFLMIVVFGTIFIGTGVLVYDSFHQRKSCRNRSMDSSSSCSYRKRRSVDKHNKNEEMIEDLIICDMLGVF